MNTVDFLAHLQNLDIQLTVEGEHLKINAPKNGLNTTLRGELAERRKELIALLSQPFEKPLAYWRKQLAGAPPLLELPTDYPRPAIQSYQADTHLVTLPASLVAQLKTFSQQEGITLDLTLLTAFEVLLYRYSGQTDIVVGSVVANCHGSELDNLMGFFANTLVLRTDLSHDPTFMELLKRVRQVTSEAYTHQEVPFEKLVEALQPERNLSYSPLVQVTFVLQNVPSFTNIMADVAISTMLIPNKTAKFDLTVYLTEEKNGEITVTAEYNSALFKAETITRWLTHYQTLLVNIISNSNQLIVELPLLTEAEQHQILVEWNDTTTDYPADKCIQQLFEAQVERTPDNIAVIFEQEQLTYHELNHRANQLAHYLQSLGVGPDVLVGICMERSIEMVIGLWGILKAGGAYVPLDPTYPAKRLAFMVEDAQVPVLLSQTSLRTILPVTAAQIIWLDENQATLSTYSPLNPANHANHGDNLAYVIYTSGSTGNPKGAMIIHRGLTNYLWWAIQAYEVVKGQGSPVHSSLSFDLTVTSLFTPLLVGAKVILLPESRDVEALQTVLENQSNFSLVKITPAHLEILSQLLSPQKASKQVNRYIIGGEALFYEQLAFWRKYAPTTHLINEYGPTETVVGCCVYEVKAEDVLVGTVPIGRPIANTQLYILDAHLQPVPIGVTGELYIGGAGLARGYLNRPELTAEKFIPNPFGEGRLYKTGDLARYLPDGNIEFLGRIDHQVKIRGFRIELGEIEAVLGSQPMIEQAIVTLKERPSGDKQLVAYLKLTPQIIDSTDTTKYVDLWQTWYNEMYSQSSILDGIFNIDGWGSSYTNKPIPSDEMREWVDETVGRIKTLNPHHVLEIGCGSGLLLARIAPQCEIYIGTDLSEMAINYTHQMCQQVAGLNHVNLLTHSADDFSGFEASQFDTIIINSVVQCFPDRLYLERVIAEALSLLKPGGHLFMGDVRHFGLLEIFHTSVQFYQADDDLVVQQLKQRIWQHQNQEKDLLLAPEYFLSLTQNYPQICHVQVLPKYGQVENELTQFRYDAILHVGQTIDLQTDITWHDWREIKSNPSQLETFLNANSSQVIGLRHIANPRFWSERYAQQWLAESKSSTTVAEYRQGLTQQPDEGVHVNHLRALAQAMGWQLEVSWLNTNGLGDYEVVFTPPHLANKPAQFTARRVGTDRSRYTNTPVQGNSAAKSIHELRDYLKTKLPNYMIPSTFMVLEKFPLTPNGKIDHQALPEPESTTLATSTEFIPPQTQTEHIVAAIWAEVLGVTQIGRHDNFFELGGHSLLATQVRSHLQATFGLEIAMRSFFEKPTLVELSHLLDTTRQDELPLSSPLTVVERSAKLPLSFAQERLWFVEQLTPNQATYNILMAYRWQGSVDISALECSLNLLIQRHETLRTTFISHDGQPQQLIHPHLELALTLIDLTALLSHEQEAQIQYLAIQESLQPFNLTQLPLFRCTLLQLNEQNHVFLLNIHHIISDGWSQTVFLQELLTIYKATLNHHVVTLPELPFQYADYAVWQRQELQGETLEKSLAYWRKQLQGAPPVLELPTDYLRPPMQSYQGDTHFCTLPAPLVAQLKALSQQESVTLFMTLLTAFEVLLYRYSGQTDLVVGSFVANRHRTELDNLIGFFINTIILRTDLSHDPTFLELLKRVRQVTLEAYTHQEVPFEKLVEALQPERNLSYSPLVQVAFVLQNVASFTNIMADVAISTMLIPNKTAKFDLTVYLTEEKNGEITVAAEYNSALFKAETITRWLTHYQTLLESSLTQLENPISQLSLMHQAEITNLLVMLNNTQIHYAPDEYVHHYFARQAARTPDAVAVFAPEHQAKPQLTYRELDERSNQLAHYLQSLGVGPNIFVGICLERIPDMVVSLFGILKAGGTYIPLDPSFPRERLAFMVEDAQITLTLTQERLLNVVPINPHQPSQLICLDRDWPIIAVYPTNPLILKSPTHSQSLAYILYTSGSTGKPKGVQISHRALINFLLSMQQSPGIVATDRLLAVTTLSFDISMLELYLPLLVGAQIILASQQVTTDGTQLVKWLHDYNITFMQATPATWRMMLETDWQPTPGLKILCGGEAMATDLAERLLPKTAALWNVYGPTETTIWSTAYHVTSLPQGSTVSIGRPIANTQIYILDKHLQPVPIGVIGDLYIGGDGVANGYLNRPELTTEKFIANPFMPHGRVYLTGDLARYLPDGNIEFLGRIDHQVKIHGFRIELGDIEAALIQHAQVKEAVVIAREDTSGDKRLVAYMVLHELPAPSVAEWRNFLQQKLPDYMIPSAFVVLEALPLTPNGKVDRRALPVPKLTTTETSQGFGLPRDDLELQMTKIWENVFKVNPISIHDSFFDLGGHSLLAVRLFTEIERVFGRNLPLATLFQAPTIEQLVNLLRDKGWKPTWSSLVPLQPKGSKPPLFCVHAIGGNILNLHDLVCHLGTDQPFYGLQSQGLDGKQTITECLEEMAAYYLEEIYTVQPHGPYYLLGQSAGGVVAFEMAQQLLAQGEKVALLAFIDTDEPATGSISVNPFTFWVEIRFYLKNFSIPRLLVGIKNVIFAQIQKKTQHLFAKMARRFYLHLGRSIPHNFRYIVVRETILQAHNRYIPKPYPGRIVLFRATGTVEAYVENQQHRPRGWSKLAGQGLDIYDIPGGHNLEREPYAGDLAKQLSEVFERTQQAANQS